MKKFFILGFISFCLFSGCESQKAVYKKVSAEEALKMMQEDCIILDVRTEAEYKEQHIGNAMLIPVDELDKRAIKELPDKNKIILVYCRSGGRSENAAKILVKLGYIKVYDFGGILNWPFGTE